MLKIIVKILKGKDVFFDKICSFTNHSDSSAIRKRIEKLIDETFVVIRNKLCNRPEPITRLEPVETELLNQEREFQGNLDFAIQPVSFNVNVLVGRRKDNQEREVSIVVTADNHEELISKEFWKRITEMSNVIIITEDS